MPRLFRCAGRPAPHSWRLTVEPVEEKATGWRLLRRHRSGRRRPGRRSMAQTAAESASCRGRDMVARYSGGEVRAAPAAMTLRRGDDGRPARAPRGTAAAPHPDEHRAVVALLDRRPVDAHQSVAGVSRDVGQMALDPAMLYSRARTGRLGSASALSRSAAISALASASVWGRPRSGLSANWRMASAARYSASSSCAAWEGRDVGDEIPGFGSSPTSAARGASGVLVAGGNRQDQPPGTAVDDRCVAVHRDVPFVVGVVADRQDRWVPLCPAVIGAPHTVQGGYSAVIRRIVARRDPSGSW